MLNPKIYFRADGGFAIGMGHLVRSLALAQMLEQAFEICFCCKEAPDSFVQDLNKLGLQFLKINTEQDWISLLKPKDITVIDHYQLGIETHRAIRAKGAKVVCIDDMHDKPFDADLIINHAPGVKILYC